MRSNRTAFEQKMLDAGVCDERCVAFCATAVALPGGETGLCLLGLKGNVLSVYDTDITATVGAKLYAVPLASVQDLKTTDSPLMEKVKGYSLRFTWGAQAFAFRNCYQSKAALAVLRGEAG
ncbi:MAG: hypothetical protein IJE07_00140 [Clostridia bacterium]|nr:hypothetical protein [Clostridia bacterium]